jgi:hypothetical protein
MNPLPSNGCPSIYNKNSRASNRTLHSFVLKNHSEVNLPLIMRDCVEALPYVLVVTSRHLSTHVCGSPTFASPQPGVESLKVRVPDAEEFTCVGDAVTVVP